MPQSFIDELIARADIVEVIGSRVQLKKAGREYKACCPFHDEKTASFWVSPEKQFYHCFGCGAHGTVLRFLMEHDRMAFPDAVEELAGRLGLEVPREAGSQSPQARRNADSLYELMARVARLYSETLIRDERAQRYLTGRGLDPEIIQRFGIGYAPNAWNEVLRRFGRDGAARGALAELGLIVEREGARSQDGERHYDRFRDRVMFPIRDARGRTIAFGGRILDKGEPKYLNSPETALFHKGRELYGLYEVRRTRSNLKRLLVVEGYMDVVRLHQSGIDYAVATLGTATTPDHLKQIFRLVSEVVFAFDGDRAGRAAAWRALQNALPQVHEGRELRFLFLPEGHDPDTLVGEEGREAFEKRLDSATLSLADYLVRELSEHADLSGPGGRARFGELARPLLEKVPEGVYRRLLLEKVAKIVLLSPENLQREWDASDAREAAGTAPPARSSAPPQPSAAQRFPGRGPSNAGRGSLVRQAIACLLAFPPIAQEVTREERDGLSSSHEPGVALLCELLDNLRAQPARVPGQVIERWRDRPEGEALQKLLQSEQILGEASAATAELRGTLRKLAERALQKRLEALEIKSISSPLD
ncbi:MAG TPA: DNA primase, partial [Steroidobacteraceae bacterium]|nr:DNA primase [Steroidobacteraceae bacterium]